ncbi:HK97 gp10 family phage protein [Cytobacillus firmus]|uniref:HK97 gp10 family phage protein n=1 Tax=Cytobacillus firmus TaxID=1399 RepID=UPI0018CF8293|nr:HK97 gp10 family phage protein [Cytobacillus firmus]MBG9548345.1 prophage pi2 protein [Cytobacillus firmus]MBG9600805.1 prophage pi2 protein [Cytobacillus firmus]MED1938939.1 HK97 gp10 family phage protein [Cytobacillus firmus]
MGFQFDDMLRLKQSLVELNKTSHQIHMKVAKRIAQLAIRKVKKMTPVDTGDLRNNWKSDVIKKGDNYIIVIYNQVEYASFVENGHRIVIAGQTVGWVEGRFMLKLTADEMQRIAPNMWQKEIDKEMRRLFGN